MKIVIAPDSFKESLTALEVAEAIEAGLKKVLPDAEYVKVPMADGGEGTVQSLVDATEGRLISAEVCAPLGNKVKAEFGLSGDGRTAIIEMAAASGLHLVPPEARNPLRTTSYGTGELICAALDEGVEKIIVGIGGSATNDGGAGMLQALGALLLDANKQPIGAGGGCLQDLAAIDLSGLDKRLAGVEIVVACDVDNPLCGPRGASVVFAPQKGANAEAVALLESSGVPRKRLTEEKAEIYEQLAELNREIRTERQKLKLCHEIQNQVPVMEQDMKNKATKYLSRFQQVLKQVNKSVLLVKVKLVSMVDLMEISL